MKKYISLIAIAFCSLQLSYAQQDAGLGIIGGTNLATIKFDFDGASVTPDRTLKIVAGFSGQSNVNNGTSFGYEFLFSQMGYEPEPGTGVDKLTLNYIAVPLLLKFWPGETINLHAGVEPAILLGGNEPIDGINASDGLKSFDLAAAVGIEVFVSENFGLGARFVPGLLDVNDTEDPVEIKNNSIRLYANIRF